MRQATRLLGASLIIFLTGCGALPAHNNTLIFAVHRKVGIDITPTNATNAGLTIGYSSNEFAWVPLWANDWDKKPMVHCVETEETTTPSLPTNVGKPVKTKIVTKCPERSSPKFVAKNADPGVRGKDEDAYSTFASFGGDIRADGANTNAGIKLASFFATGIAAQQLAENAHGLTSVGSTNEKKPEAIPAFDAAKKQLQNFLTMTASETKTTPSAPATQEVCLNKLGLTFDGKPSTRFAWVKGRTPAEAVKGILANSDWSEADLNKLNGAAYGLAQESTAEISIAEDSASKATPPTKLDASGKAKAASKACESTN